MGRDHEESKILKETGQDGLNNARVKFHFQKQEDQTGIMFCYLVTLS